MRNRNQGRSGTSREVWRAAGAVAGLALIALVQLVWTRLGPPAGDVVTGEARVIDGDSLRIGREEIRLKGIDAPEGRQTCERRGETWRCGEAAAQELRRLSQGGVSCRIVERDQHGRGLGFCEASGQDINRAMVLSGAAVDYGHYRDAEADARSAGRGLWSGTFERPREWRRKNGIGG